MYAYLTGNVTSHDVTIEGNKIIGKRLIKTSSFRSFTITFLKCGKEVSIVTSRGRTIRFDDEQDL